MIFQLKKATSIGLSVAFALSAALPALAVSPQDNTHSPNNHSIVAKANTVCRHTARKAYVAAIHRANADFKTARDAARAVLKTALKEANGDPAKEAEALHVYKDALKVARNTIHTVKEAALTAFKTAHRACRA